MNKGVSSKKRKKILEEDDKLEAMGQESEEKAVKWVVEENQNVELKREKDYQDTLTFFDSKRKTFKTYYEAMANLLNNLLKHYVDYQNMEFHTEVTINRVRGVGVLMTTPDKKVFGRGFKPCGEPKYDLHAVKVLIWQTENVIDEYIKQKEGEAGGTDSGESKDSNGIGSQKVSN